MRTNVTAYFTAICAYKCHSVVHCNLCVHMSQRISRQFVRTNVTAYLKAIRAHKCHSVFHGDLCARRSQRSSRQFVHTNVTVYLKAIRAHKCHSVFHGNPCIPNPHCNLPALCFFVPVSPPGCAKVHVPVQMYVVYHPGAPVGRCGCLHWIL